MQNSSPLGPIPIVPFSRDIQRSEFTSGNLDLDQWLKRYAKQSEDKFQTRTFFALSDVSELLGYYANTFGEVSAHEEIESLALSNYSRPAYLIARLAVDSKWQGRGIGRMLIFDALDKAIRASSLAGLELVIVEAIDEHVVKFYEGVGFQRFSSSSTKLFITMKSLVHSS